MAAAPPAASGPKNNVEILVPQISWHAQGASKSPDPIQSVDCSPAAGLIATAGNDNEVRLWRVPARKEVLVPQFVQALQAHSKVVNVVRFCPQGVTLASAGDDATIFLYRERAAKQAFGEPAPKAGAMQWAAVCALRGHCDDVYDLCWSPRGEALFSGGVDGTTIVWNIEKAKPAQIVREHEHYVQGVAWDPADEYIVSVSLDRTARLYAGKDTSALKKKKVPGSVGGADDSLTREFDCRTVLAKRTATFALGGSGKAPMPAPEEEGGVRDSEPTGPTDSSAGTSAAPSPPPAAGADRSGSADTLAASSSSVTLGGFKTTRQVHLFQDDSVNHFYRRPAWSPDGSFLLLPCGQHFPNMPPPLGAAKPTTFVFNRGNLAAPCAHLPSPDKAVVAIRFCQTLFEKRDAAAKAGDGDGPSGAPGEGAWMANLPYRVLWAVATLSSVVVYDSSERAPLLVASNLHYEALTDLAWLPDGSGIIASSIDGYCMLLRFRPGILGNALPADKLPACMKPKPRPSQAVSMPGSSAAGPEVTSFAASSGVAPVQTLQVRHKPKVEPPAAAATASTAGTTSATSSAAASSKAQPAVRRIAPVPISSGAASGGAPAVRRIAPVPITSGTSASAEPAVAPALVPVDAPAGITGEQPEACAGGEPAQKKARV